MPKKIVEQEKFQTVGLFSSKICHELNNPLVGVKGYTQILMEGAGGEQKDMLEQILSMVIRIENTIQQLKEFSENQSIDDSESLNLSDFMQDQISKIEDALNRDHIEVNLVMDPTLEFMGSRPNLEVIIRNLVANSLYSFKNQQYNNSKKVFIRAEYKI